MENDCTIQFEPERTNQSTMVYCISGAALPYLSLLDLHLICPRRRSAGNVTPALSTERMIHAGPPVPSTNENCAGTARRSGSNIFTTDAALVLIFIDSIE